MPPIQHRHLLALPRGDGNVFLSWRLLPTDPPDAPFFIERMVKGTWRFDVGDAITESTNCRLSCPDGGEQQYRVVAVDGTPSETVTVVADADASPVARCIPLDPEGRVQHLVTGDLTNDGRQGFVVRYAKGGTVRFAAHAADGTHLWMFDTHLPEEGGWDGSMHHVPFLAWDLNADGRTEVAFHSYPSAYPTDRYATAIDGECYTVVDGETGEVVDQVPWPGVESRVMMTVGHLDGLDEPASVIVLNETYGDVVLTALDGSGGHVKWRVEQHRGAGHNLDVADIDEDGIQEVICGGCCYNGDGSLRWEAETFGHTDISKPARICPDRKGLQIWYAVEKDNPGVYLVDNNGTTLWKEPFEHAHYGWVTRHAPGVPGLHPHAAEDGRSKQHHHFPVFLPDGTHWLDLTDWQRKNFVPIHWDEGDEVVFIIRKEDKRVVRLTDTGEIEDLPEGDLPAAAEYGRNLACVDVLGDFRENIVCVDPIGHNLLVLANPAVTSRRGRSPIDDFAYRHDRSQLGSGYYIYLSPPITTV